jgi:Mn2+/Fe2+ NRAMP family transporter
MGDCLHMLIGGNGLLSAFVYTALFAVASVALQIRLSYTKYASLLKWGSLVLGVYIITAFVIHPNWSAVAKATCIPSISFSRAYLATFVAVLGTTISPYLFFWQASLEAEETKIVPGDEPLTKAPEQAADQYKRIRIDTVAGMAVSNIVAFFIILTAGATLHAHHITDVQTAQDAAKALEPLAGRFASLLFSLGIIGGGLLAVPVLGGSVAYAVGELMHWPVGQDRKPHKAKGFYSILILTTLLAVILNLLHINPIKALFWSAVVNGIASVPIMILIMLMFSSRKVMGKFARVSPILRIVGWLATLAMTAAAVALFATLGK